MPLDWGNLPSHFRPKCSIKPPRSLSIIMSIFSRTKYFFPNFLWWNKSPFILLLNTNHQCTSSNVINPLWNFFLALGFPSENFDILRGECFGNIWKFSIQKSGPILFPAAKSSIKPSLTHFSLLQFQRIGRLSTSHTLFSSKLYNFCHLHLLFKHSRLLDLDSQTQVKMSLFCATHSQCCLDKSREMDVWTWTNFHCGRWSDGMTILVRMKTLVQIA